MRGAKCLGALFLCVASLVISRAVGDPVLQSDEAVSSLYNRGDVLEREYLLQENAAVAKSFLTTIIRFGNLKVGLIVGNAVPGKDEITPLHLACMHGLVDEARELIALGADVDAIDREDDRQHRLGNLRECLEE